MKIVLDVGTGSGILAIWAAQAGAKKVYAVEATQMARHARNLVVGNGVEHVVEIIEGAIEDVNIPEKGIKFSTLRCNEFFRTGRTCWRQSVC